MENRLGKFIERSVLSLICLIPFWSFAQGDLRDCGYNCTSQDITILGFELVDATTGNPIANSISECGDGQTFQVKLEMTYRFNAASTRYNARFQSMLRIGDMDIFVNEYVGTFNSSTNESKLIVYDTFTWECGTNLSFFNPQFFWRTGEGGVDLETSYVCNDYSNSKCSTSSGETIVDIPIELPVVWHDFTVEFIAEKSLAEINWSTLKEWESSYFEIERSSDDIDNFVVIDTVHAANYSFEIKHYQFLDKNLPPNRSKVYYRLKQIDLDGKYTYSKVLLLTANDANVTDGTWMLFPNPVIGNDLKLCLKKHKDFNVNELTMKITTSQRSYSYLLANIENPHEIDIGTLIKDVPKGLLIFELAWEDKVQIIKAIKH